MQLTDSRSESAIKLNVKKSNCMVYYNNMHWANDQTTFSFYMSWWVSIDHEAAKIFKMLSLSPLPSASSQTTLVKLVFRSLGARVNNIKFGDGVCTAHVQERAVLHDVERMLPRYSSFSRFLSVWQGGRRERERERERERASRGTRLGHMAHLRLNSHISRLSWSG